MPGPFSHRLALAGLRLVPKNAVSRVAGRVAALRLPAAWRAPVCRTFGRTVGVDFSEVRDPLESFPSLQAFFTRALRDGVRPVDPAADAIVSPCDGTWGAAGPVTDGTVLQMKGRPYALASLLGDAGDALRFEGGSFATLYLSPRDYHRFHTPCAARVESARYLPGNLWPVNRIGVEGVDGLFAENERICAFFAPDRAGAAAFCVVAVGATMVGKVRVTFDDLASNVPGAGPAERRYGVSGARFGKGQEWGRFEFGSTLVLLLPAGAVLEAEPPGTPVRLGTRIAHWSPSGHLATPGSEATVSD
jgi:phosphatidylserine decarboxylase